MPGIAGSVLDAQSATGNLWPGPADYFRLTLDKGNILFYDPTVFSPDVIRYSQIPQVGDIYGTLLDTLKTRYREYDVKGNPALRTTSGCDLSQKKSDPNENPSLFVFAYDWRKSNIENATRLRDYVGCVQQFYPDPNIKIDILTHSMGGLLARRYLIAYSSDHHIGKFVTIAAPWLGAPKAIDVLETGTFFEANKLAPVSRIIIKNLSEFFPSVHELLPSAFYFGLGGRPRESNGTIVNNYDEFVNLTNQRFPRSNPGTTNRLFHATSGQDDGRVAPTDIENFHIYGVKGGINQPRRDTTGSVGISRICHLGLFFTQCDIRYFYSYTFGDGTVPLLSAERRGIGPGLDLNDSRAVLLPFYDNNNPDSVSHTGLTRNSVVLSSVLTILRSSSLPQAAKSSNRMIPDVIAGTAYYIKLSGASQVTVTDSSGHSTNPLSDPPDPGIAGIVTNITGQKSADIILSLDQPYTILFRSDGEPLSLEITRESNQPDQAIRYQDLILPTGIMMKFSVTPQGIGSLVYDSDSNGTFETTVTPTVSVSGTAAEDTQAPNVAISGIGQGNNAVVTVSSSDSGSGVKITYYSLDGTHFQPYAGPFSVNPYQGPVVYAFADDNVANRSGLVTYYPSYSSNQLDNAQFFARQHYLDFLNREPDASGLGFWTNEITLCGTDAACIDLKRINVSAAFYLSIEFQGTGYLVERIYKAAYGDAQGTSTFNGTHQLAVPIVRLNEFLPDTQAIGQGVVVNQTGWEQVLENNKQAFTAEFVQRSRFTSAFPASLTPTQFVDTLNANAGNPLSTAERNQLVNDLTNGVKTRAQVLRAVAEDQDLSEAEFRRAFVLMQYFGYLRRNPNDPQDTDYTGYDFWLTKLNQFNGNFVNAEMVKAFIVSGEYRGRFGP